MSTNSRFYAMYGVHFTEEDINEIEIRWDSDEPICAINELERLAKENGLEAVATLPTRDSSCVVGGILFESDGWDDQELVSLERAVDRKIIQGVARLVSQLPDGIKGLTVDYHVFVQIG